MRRVAFEVRLEAEVPDGAPDPELLLALAGLSRTEDGGLALTVSVPGGRILEAEGGVAPTRDEQADALDAVVSMLPEEEVAALERELHQAVGVKAVKVLDHWVERRFIQNEGRFGVAVWEGGLPGVTETYRQAALRLLREKHRRSLGAW